MHTKETIFLRWLLDDRKNVGKVVFIVMDLQWREVKVIWSFSMN